MRYRTIPGTTLSVSELSFGNFIYGSHMWGKTAADAPEGIRLQNLAFDLGVNFFDTGDAYSNGHAERLMAETLRYAGRDKIILSTKFGYDFYSDPGSAPGTPGSHKERKQDFSEKFITFALEQSLQRMQTDHVELYQAHNIKLPQMTQYAHELLAAMENLTKAGKIRHWGIALGPAIGWRDEGAIALNQWSAQRLASSRTVPNPSGCVTVQTVFNMLEQHPGRELCELAAETHSAAIIARVPHSSGILEDKYSPDEKFDDHRKFRDKNWLVYGLKKVEKLRHIQQRHQNAAGQPATMGQLALQWLLTWPAVASVQPNITTESELREFAAACNGEKLASAEMAEIQSLVESDFGYGPDAHACNLKSSIDPNGHTSSRYQRNESIPDLNADYAIMDKVHKE